MEATVLAAEAQLAEAQKRVEDPAIASDANALQQRATELSAAEAEVDRLYARWAELKGNGRDASVERWASAHRGTGDTLPECPVVKPTAPLVAIPSARAVALLHGGRRHCAGRGAGRRRTRSSRSLDALPRDRLLVIFSRSRTFGSSSA